MFQMFCEENGWYLVEIEDAAENTFVKTLMADGTVYHITKTRLCSIQRVLQAVKMIFSR